MATSLSSIKISAELDASGYIAAAQKKAAADQAMVDGADKLNTSIDVTQRKLSDSGGEAERWLRPIQAQKRLEAGTAALQRPR